MVKEPTASEFDLLRMPCIPAYAIVLSERERACLRLLCQGHRNKRIAALLGVTSATVEFHLANARLKLGAKTREQAVALAVFFGLVTP